MAVTLQDIEELAERIAEKGGEDSLEWLESTGIDGEAFNEILRAATRQGIRKVLADGDLAGAFLDISGQAFRLGWQAHEEFA